MAEQIVSPDLNFVKEVIASGADSLKKCYQCSTCTVVCEVTPDKKPFPRKEMLQAQWGMKDQLLTNPDIWMCHQCSDCTAYCPRGAKPGEVLGAVRKMAIKEYSAPRLLAEWTANSKYVLLLFAIPVMIFLFELFIQGHFTNGIPRNEMGKISYSLMFPPTKFIDTVFVPTAFFAAICFILGIKKYWEAMVSTNGAGSGDLTQSIIGTIKDIITHKKFAVCGVAKDRKVSHMLVFFAFIGLAITTSIGVLYLYGYEIFGIETHGLINFGESPYPLYDPMKIIGNASAIALLIGITLVINNRMKNKEKAGMGSYFDWLFIFIVYGVGATGFLAEILRLFDLAVLAYPMYFAHLVFIFVLFAYAPFSKMAHMVYRTTAMVFARHTGRE
ncbi:MAG TPA: quinone-interacting membrane-bound oxidoreductase complex subunit QmoC [Dissulfurispiraceae bacterium]|nr:quinone-interacting membrane-bound oxidoreductase complex subunit QmoC [Dissulfurispiraceae bacterium]